MVSSAHFEKISEIGLDPWYAALRHQSAVLPSEGKAHDGVWGSRVWEFAHSTVPLSSLPRSSVVLYSAPPPCSLSSEWNSTSRPAATATSDGHDAVLRRSTIPKVGLSAREAIPVLNCREGISRIAVPVVSEPVPYVMVGQKGVPHA